MFARVGAGKKYLGLVGRGGRTVRRCLLVQRQKVEEDKDSKEAEEAEEERSYILKLFRRVINVLTSSLQQW